MTCLATLDDASLTFPLRLVSGVDQVVVRLRVRHKTIVGEWILDTSLGFPWRSWFGLDASVSMKGPTEAEARAVERAQLEATTGVTSVLAVTATERRQVMTIDARLIAEDEGEQGEIVIAETPDPLNTQGAPAGLIRVVSRGPIPVGVR